MDVEVLASAHHMRDECLMERLWLENVMVEGVCLRHTNSRLSAVDGPSHAHPVSQQFLNGGTQCGV